jgi:hypothetical protein
VIPAQSCSDTIDFMATREDAIQLAKRDTSAALDCARSISEPWYRCQALGWVARFAPDEQFQWIVDEALQTAASSDAPYVRVGAAAWPIRALIERSAVESAEKAIKAVLAYAPQIDYLGSRAWALCSVFEAAKAGPDRLWLPVVDAMLDFAHPPLHWRHRRAIRDAVLTIVKTDPEMSKQIISRLTEEKLIQQLNRHIEAGLYWDPRPFFR